MQDLESRHQTSSTAMLLAYGTILFNTFLHHFPLPLEKGVSNLLWEWILPLRQYDILGNAIMMDGIGLLFLCLGLVSYYPRKQLKREQSSWLLQFLLGLSLLFGTPWLAAFMDFVPIPAFGIRLFLKVLGLTCLMFAGVNVRRLWSTKGILGDRFNADNESFEQDYPRVENPFSVNIAYRYSHKGRERRSWINIINLFRSLLVIGTTGSGKSFGVIEEILRQWMAKGYPLALYDFKFPTQTQIVYNYLQWYQKAYAQTPKLYIINLDDPAYSHRCNPLDPQYLEKQQDAINCAIALLYNINRKWVEKKGEFFVDSPIVYVAALIWFLKLASEKYNANYCTLPHVLVLAQQSPEPLFKLLQSEPEVKLLINTFKDALDLSAMEQLAGQTGSANIGLSQLVSKELFFIMGDNQFSLDMNNPKDPKILCFGNHPARKEAYAAPLGVYLSTLTRVVNKKGQLPSGLFLDELPTLYILGLDDFIATVRSNKVATIMGIQNMAQLIRDYGQRIADVIAEISGNIIVGQVTFKTAKLVSELFGKIKQQRYSVNSGEKQESTTLSTQMDALIPPSKIAQFSQGTFAGILADRFDQKLPNKLFHGETIMDMDLKKQQTAYELPLIHDFSPKDVESRLAEWMRKAEQYRVVEFLNSKKSLDVHHESELAHILKILGLEKEGKTTMSESELWKRFRGYEVSKNQEKVLDENFKRIGLEVEFLMWEAPKKKPSPEPSSNGKSEAEIDALKEIDYFW